MTGTAAGSGRPYDRPLAEQQAIPAGHELGDPNAGDAVTHRFTDAERARGRAHIAEIRARLATHRHRHEGAPRSAPPRADPETMQRAAAQLAGAPTKRPRKRKGTG